MKRYFLFFSILFLLIQQEAVIAETLQTSHLTPIKRVNDKSLTTGLPIHSKVTHIRLNLGKDSNGKPRNLPFQGMPVYDEISGKVFFIYPYAKSDSSAAAWLIWPDKNDPNRLKIAISRNSWTLNEGMITVAGYEETIPTGLIGSVNEPFFYTSDDKTIKIDFTNSELRDAMYKVAVELLIEANGRYDKIKLHPETIVSKLKRYGKNFPEELDPNDFGNLTREMKEEINVVIDNLLVAKIIDLKINNSLAISTGFQANRTTNKCTTKVIYLKEEPKIQAGDDVLDVKIVYADEITFKDASIETAYGPKSISVAYYIGNEFKKDNKGAIIRTDKEVELPINFANRRTLEKALKKIEDFIVSDETSFSNNILGTRTYKTNKMKNIIGSIKDLETNFNDLNFEAKKFVMKYIKGSPGELKTRLGKESSEHFSNVRKISRCYMNSSGFTVSTFNKCFEEKIAN